MAPGGAGAELRCSGRGRRAAEGFAIGAGAVDSVDRRMGEVAAAAPPMISKWHHMVVSINGGTPKWIVYEGKSH